MTRYYQQLLEEYDRSIERKIDERNKAAKRGDAQVQASARREEIALRAERNVLAAHYAYYDILADPQEGLLRCNEATPDDIWAFNMVGYALKKRERESALSKLRLQLPGYVTDMEQVRVLTVVDQNRKGALDLLEKLDDPQIFSRPELAKSTFQADVKIYQGINISYLPPLANVSQDAPPDLYALVHKWVGEKSPFERAVELIQEAVAILQEKKKLPLSELEQTALNSSFARAYSAQAYPLSRLGRLTEAADAHRDCITYASHGQLPETLSHARNDLGYIYVRLGKFAVAEDMIRRGLAIRERLGLAYFVALGYNTLGVLEFLHDRPHRGVPHCQEALSLFEELGDKRGIGLANLTLGKNKGRIGEVELDRDAFEAARRCYAKALEVFSTPDASGQLVEPARLAETYEWLGILDSMWGGIFLVEVGADPDEIAKHLAQADQYFQKAIQGYESAGRKLEQAIALERWARVYRDVAVHTRTSPQDKQEQFALAQARLSEAEAIALKQAPEVELRPLSEGGSPSIPDTRHPEYRLVLGKVERLRGRLAFDQVLEAQADDERQRLLKETASHFTLACAYSEQFSKEASELGTALRQATERLWSLKYPEMGAFLEYVLAIQKDYGLSAYTSLPERIQDVASIEG
jgi:tetratricopeptide (TPR) repeat protein